MANSIFHNYLPIIFYYSLNYIMELRSRFFFVQDKISFFKRTVAAVENSRHFDNAKLSAL
jgi:hypothetical protein